MVIKTKIIGIVNLAPDSFSDGGEVGDVAVRIARLADDGAYGVDIGAESTRPGAVPLSADEEWARLSDVLPGLKAQFPHLILSLDTRHPQTAKRALDCGINWINDVSGGAPEMLQVAKAASQLVLMHSLSVPADPKHLLSEGADPVMAVQDWAREKLRQCEAVGIASERLILDPGIGFGKSAKQSWELIKRFDELKKIQIKWLIGHSRKSFLSAPRQKDAKDRDLETHLLSLELAKQGVDYLRVHDVSGTRRALEVATKLVEAP